MPDFDYSQIPVDKLIETCSRTFHTIDGLWFLAIEAKYGFDIALEMNAEVWRPCSLIHAKRVLKNFNIKEDTPLKTLIKLINTDPLLYAHQPVAVSMTDTRAVVRCLHCPTQVARIRDGKGVYPGEKGCTIFYEAYAEVVDPRIKVTCVSCAPNPESPEYWCEWKFEFPEDGDN